jgi:internalin A
MPRMPAPKMSTFLKKARYLIPFVKPLTLGLIDPKDETTKEMMDAWLDLLGDEAKEKLKDYLAKEPDAASGLIDEHLVRHSGAVLGKLVKRYAQKHAAAEQRADLLQIAKAAPEAWSGFLQSNALQMVALRKDALQRRLTAALDPKSSPPELESEAFVEFFRWLAKQKNLIGPLKAGLTPPLTRWITKHLDQELFTELCRDTTEGKAAFKETVLRFHGTMQRKLNLLAASSHQHGKALAEIKEKQQDQATKQDLTEIEQTMELGVKELKQMREQFEKTSPLQLYREGLKEEYHFIEVITLDTAEDPKVREAISEHGIVLRDAYVEPPCSVQYQHPEEFDQDVMDQNSDWEPFMARLARHRRIVLLADPGMGKSTLIRSLLHSIASKRPPAEAGAELGCCVPFPLILRNLVPMLLEHQPDSSKWRWADLLEVFQSWCPGNSTRPLLEPFTSSKENRASLQQLFESPLAFFLIDGLDEVGSISLRRDMQRVLWEGFRVSHAQARFLITSRVIGYDAAPVHAQQTGFAPVSPRARMHAHRQAVMRFGDAKMADLVEVFPDVPLLEDHAQLLHLTPFTDEHQRKFAQYWFGRRFSRGGAEGSTERFIKAAHAHDSVRLISRNPYILLLLVFVYQDKHELPDGRTKIYDRVAELYLKVLDDKARLNSRLGPIARCSPDQKKHWLQIIAMQMQLRRTQTARSKRGRTKSDQRETHAATGSDIAGWLSGLIESNGYRNDNDAAKAFVEYLGERTGLLVPRGPDHFEWHHNSFMEFFAALYIRDELFVADQLRLAGQNPDAPRAELEAANLPAESLPGPIPARHAELACWAGDERWHEIIIFLLEYMSGPGKGLELSRHLRGIFPPLYGIGKVEPEKPAPLLALPAVELAVQIAHDVHLALSVEVRQSWWSTLWDAQLQWPHKPWHSDESKRWHIAPELLRRVEMQEEVLHCLTEVQPKHPASPLRLNLCTTLTTEALSHLDKLKKIDVLDLEGCSGLTTLPVLPVLGRVKKLSLQGCTGLQGQEAWQRLSQFKNLEKLYLGGCTAFNDTLLLAGLQKLKLLEITNCTGLQKQEAWQGLAELKELETFYLGGCTGLTSLLTLADLKKLRVLDLRNCTGLKGPAAWQGLAALKSLEALYLDGCTELECLPDLCALQDLQIISLWGCTGLKDAVAFSGLTTLASLESLYLSDCTGLERLPDLSALQNLRMLILWRCTGLKDAASLTKQASLQHLDLSGCTGLERLPDLTALKNLQRLHLWDCTGLHGLESLNGLTDHPSLESLDLTGCTGLGPEALQELRRKLGNHCAITGPDGRLVE